MVGPARAATAARDIAATGWQLVGRRGLRPKRAARTALIAACVVAEPHRLADHAAHRAGRLVRRVHDAPAGRHLHLPRPHGRDGPARHGDVRRHAGPGARRAVRPRARPPVRDWRSGGRRRADPGDQRPARATVRDARRRRSAPGPDHRRQPGSDDRRHAGPGLLRPEVGVLCPRRRGLPSALRVESPARIRLGTGETYDFVWTPSEPGDAELVVHVPFATEPGELLLRRPLRVR
jgi:hypothetical protein